MSETQTNASEGSSNRPAATPQPTAIVEPGSSIESTREPSLIMGAGSRSRDELTLTVPGVFALTGQPREQYELHITRVSKDVLKEASNLATGRPEGSRKKRTEFHSDHVDKAFQLIAERGLKRKARPGWYTAGRITQGIATLVTGATAALMTLPDTLPLWGYCFVGSFAITIFLVIVLEVADRSLAK